MADAEAEVVLKLTTEYNDAIASLNEFGAQLQSALSNAQDTVATSFKDIQDKATETADHLTAEGKRAGEGFAKGIELISGALAGAYLLSLKGTVSQVQDMAESLATLTLVTGDSKGRLQQFQYALTQMGVPAQNLQFELTILQSRIASLANSANQGKGPLHALGLEAKDLAGKDSITQIEAISDRIKKLGDNAKVADIRQLFGFRGASLIPLLDLGKTGIENLMKAFKPIPDDVLDSFSRFHEVTEGFKATFTAFNASLLKPIIDGLTTLTLKATEFINKLRELPGEDQFAILVGLIATTAVAFEGLTEIIGTFFKSMGSTVLIDVLEAIAVPLRVLAALVLFVALAWKSNFGNIRGVIVSVFETLTTFVANARNVLMQLWEIVGPIMMQAFNQLRDAVEQLLTQFALMLNAVLNNDEMMLALRAAVVLVVGVILLFIEYLVMMINMLTAGLTAIRALADILSGAFAASVGYAEQVVSDFIQKLADLGAASHMVSQSILDAMTTVSKGLAVMAKSSHDSAQKAIDDLKKIQLTGGKEHLSSKLPPSWQKFLDGLGKHASGKGPGAPGEANIPDEAKGKKGPDAATTDIDALKQKLIPFQEAVKEAEGWVAQLEATLSSLGHIDSPEKLAQATNILNDKLMATASDTRRLVELLHAEQAAEAEMGSKAKSSGNAADKNRYLEEERSLHDAILGTQLKITKNNAVDAEISDKKAQLAETAFAIIKDENASWPERLAAEAAKLAYLQKEKVAYEEQKKVIEDTVKIEADRRQQQLELVKAQNAGALENIEVQKANTHGPDADITKAQLDQVAAEIKLTDAQNALTAAQLDYNAQLSISTTDSQSVVAADITKKNAAIEVTKADQALKEATQAVTNAQNAWIVNIKTQVQDFVIGALGPLKNAFVAVADYLKNDFHGSIDSLVGLFFDLFKSTQAYQDIQTAVTEIVSALGKVLDSLRPVIDLLIGVLIGLVNVFLSVYDVIASLLNVFGLQIQKIKLLNSDLQNLDTATIPLIQIIHNLPTINEFNKGKWSSLQGAAQSPTGQTGVNNTVLQGFNKTMAKLGEIVGILIGAYLILVASNVLHGLSFLQHILHTAQGVTQIASQAIIAEATSLSIPAEIAFQASLQIGAITAGTAAIVTAIWATAALQFGAASPVLIPAIASAAAAALPIVATIAGGTAMSGLDLASIFGNGTTVGPSAGGGGGGGSTTITTIQIENVNGLDADKVTQTLQPVIDKIALQLSQAQAINTRTRNYSYGRIA